MGARTHSLVVVFLLLPATALADRHKWDMAIAPVSNAKRSDLWGGHVGGALTVWAHPPDPKCKEIPVACVGPGRDPCACIGPNFTYVLPEKLPPHRWVLAVLGDIGHHWGQHQGADFTQTSAAGGLRLTFGRYWGEPFVHGLVGGFQSHTSGVIDTNWLLGAGAGFDVVFRDKFVARFQADYFKVFSTAGDGTYPRFSVGFVYRLEPPPPH